MRILFVDDDEDARLSMALLLQELGHEVSTASNGLEALERSQQVLPAVVISDILMPKMDGFELCRQMKCNPDLKRIPFIFYTASYVETRDEQFGMELGAASFLMKPAGPEELAAAIELSLSKPQKISARLAADPLQQAGFIETHRDRLARKLEQKVLELERERQQLRRSEEKYRRLVENLQEYFFYSHGTDGVFTYLSPSIQQILGYSEREFCSHYTEYLTDNPMNQNVKRTTDLAIQNIIQTPYEIEILHKNGSKHILEVSEYPIANEKGEVVAVEGVAHDITPRKQAELKQKKLERRLQQAQKMEAIGTLAGGIAHDFNNILTAIIGYTELAQEDVFPGTPVSEKLEEVLTAGNRARTLIRQILAFSHQSPQERIPIQIHLVVKEAIKLLRSTIPTTIKLKDNIDPQSDSVLADPTQIHQIVMNLATNAYHAIRETGGELAITLKPVQIEKEDAVSCDNELLPGRYVKLEVSDTGHGMDKETMENIFTPYFTTKEREEGTGLGLATVQGIVQSSGGHILVNSRQGKGSTFQVYLPQIDSEQGSEEGEKQRVCPTGTEHILLVDDEVPITRILQQLLESLGYRVNTFIRGKALLETFQRTPDDFDLVITDMTMPEMTGVELSRNLLAIRSDIPIILCTGYSDLINKEKAEALGIKGYIMKPIFIRKLSMIVRRVLDETKSCAL
ncbi:response regulator [Desulfoluna sp.]|uniref:ATP-binding response regulator n=1 Tax=Desulfoluna sp. TaxID=2045199 RepID=UPI00260C3E52|nr:response regulator [Desulfoluna sp.]